ncbi:hypothetical protein [Acinetobacter sp. PK01]|uniref:hypothetical protein n=1 Tax=Acinetobacter sp. PK01 TaxID=2930198 RepID=UPI001FB80677|nr:hypothetical protein [Acinetobacter sp. PK01]UOG16962.1 hypothetical protein MP622_10615 [Acinetobacter sp. PK01]
MKKFTTLALSISITVLSGCGGGSGDSTSSTPPSTSNSSSGGSTTLTCNRGILLNSQITGTTIFDEPLYNLDYEYKSSVNTPNYVTQLYADVIQRNGQMLYVNYAPIYNVSAEELDKSTAENEEIYEGYILNSQGLYTQKTLQKQSSGWPYYYLSSSQGLQVSTALFNDECSLNAGKQNFNFEKIDLSGKTIADIFPTNILTGYPKTQDYIYLHNQIGMILKGNKDALAALLSSTATFPSGSYVYVPKSIVYDDYQFYFSESTVTDATSLNDWIQKHYGQSDYTYKIGKVSNLDVAYSVDSSGNPLYEAGADPAISKDGKIYDGEWDVKGDILSPEYGMIFNGELVNYDSKGSYTLFNKSSFEFIAQQIKNNYPSIN